MKVKVELRDDYCCYGRLWQWKLKWQFADADEFHSVENKKKMSAGQALTEQDRLPWLQSIHKYAKRLSQSNQSGVITCSALKKIYRDVLRYGTSCKMQCTAEIKPDTNVDNKCEHLKDSDLNDTHKEGVDVVKEGVDIVFIHLTGSREVLESRLTNRMGHFMPAEMLQSQLDTLENLESQEKGFTVDINNTETEITKTIISQLNI
ncbi:probable gluconokinase isoform X2 [Ruditapes philippinarum]|uniref:probable gluconokinase isoform X2 n=1 Tax=Ruditapes philippinarum TaxID=129788 RepID=UPI00295BF70B|nr:probable gluconokinase isoform X2 [Ruditapes philippinarum]